MQATQDKTGIVYKQVLACKKDIPAITKSRTNSLQKYNFRGIDDFFNALCEPLNKHGLITVPKVCSFERTAHETKNGSTAFSTYLHMAIEITAEDGSCIIAEGIGEGIDHSDKSAAKAMSAAFKSITQQLFCIATEDTPDADDDTPEVASGKKETDLGFDGVVTLIELTRSAFGEQMQAGLAALVNKYHLISDITGNKPENAVIQELLKKHKVSLNASKREATGLYESILNKLSADITEAAEAA